MLSNLPAAVCPYSSCTEWISPPTLGPSWALSRMPQRCSPSLNMTTCSVSLNLTYWPLTSKFDESASDFSHQWSAEVDDFDVRLRPWRFLGLIFLRMVDITCFPVHIARGLKIAGGTSSSLLRVVWPFSGRKQEYNSCW